MKERIIAAFLAVVLCVGLAGCDGQQEPVAASSEISATPEPTAASTPTPEEDDPYDVSLGSETITIERHPVKNGTKTAELFDIGVGQSAIKTRENLTSDELSEFISQLEFEDHGYNSIVLSLSDGNAIAFQRDSCTITNDYGYVDVSPGNFTIVKRYGAFWNDTGDGWYYRQSSKWPRGTVIKRGKKSPSAGAAGA